MPRFRRRITASLVAFALIIVHGGHAQQPRDSSGVRIWDYRRQTSVALGFVVSDTPFVRVRAFTPDDTGDYGAVAVALLKNGGLAVGVSHTSGKFTGPVVLPGANGVTTPPSAAVMTATAPTQRTMDVRLFNAAGDFSARLGSYGSTLGQFASAPQFIQEPPNGEILAVTARPEILRFKASGDLVRGARFGYGNRGTYGGGILSDQSIAIGVEQTGYDIAMGSNGLMVRRTEFAYARYDASGALIEQLPIALNYRYFSQGHGEPLAGESPWPGNASDVVRAGGSNIWKFDPIVWELQNFDVHGKLLSISRPPIPAGLRGAALGQVGQPAAFATGMLVDDEGRLWFRSIDNQAPPPPLSPQSWSVYDATGQYRGEVMVPASLRILGVQQSSLLGVYRTTEGASEVAAFRFGVKR